MDLSGSLVTIVDMSDLDFFNATTSEQTAVRAPEPARPRRTRGRTAGVLVGALLVGGGAGLGGAAAYDTWLSDDGTAISPSSGPITASNASAVTTGSVEDVAAAVLPSVVKVNVMTTQGAATGSGVVMSADGNIVTNNHVVEGAADENSITVDLSDGRTVPAKVIGTDPATDLAVIKAEGVTDLTPAKIGKSSDLKVGQEVVAFGSPYGLSATVTAGIVSALNRPITPNTAEQSQPDPFGAQPNTPQAQDVNATYPAIQTDAAINPGNSGGPLVNMNGQVVGINSSIRTASTGSDSGSIGLGFAIPIDELVPIVNQILAGETPTHARLGVSYNENAQAQSTQGAPLATVESGGAADQAGLQEGDLITKVGDVFVSDYQSLVAAIRAHRPGDTVTITYVRDGQTDTTEATLGTDADETAS